MKHILATTLAGNYCVSCPQTLTNASRARSDPSVGSPEGKGDGGHNSPFFEWRHPTPIPLSPPEKVPEGVEE